MSALGFEPRTYGLKGHCSTTELCTLFEVFREGWDSNPWWSKRTPL